MFWELTPREFWAIAAQRHEATREEWLKVGFLAASMYNSQPQWSKQKRKAVKPHDLLPALRPVKQQRKEQTVAEMKFIAQMVHANFMAAQRVNRRARDKGGPAVRAPKPPTTRR